MDYRKSEGEWYERELARELRLKGWTNVRTTPSSGDYGADIIAFDNNGFKTAIQCKYYSKGKKVSSDAVQQVYFAKDYYGCDRAIIITSSVLTPQARSMARGMEIEVWENRYPAPQISRYCAKCGKIEIINPEQGKKYGVCPYCGRRLSMTPHEKIYRHCPKGHVIEITDPSINQNYDYCVLCGERTLSRPYTAREKRIYSVKRIIKKSK